ncbi:YbaN family protein [Vibrio sp. S4M6]|uniref:YbaN family protein n=1 Tax=Vibrio sinus TaxID=2946865 RepID=UPI00202A460A|nr:YbaN family protein [Vibrio sinus]MCL9781082.1 YbaN family protein [Vibrio sinus]
MISCKTKQKRKTLSKERIKRKGYICVGWTSVILGLIGVTVPLLPTVPFILLALYCFGVASPKFQHWLLTHKRLGPIARRLQSKSGLTVKEKVQSLILIWISMGAMFYFVALGTHWQWAILGLIVFETWFILRFKTHRPNSDENIKPTE